MRVSANGWILPQANDIYGEMQCRRPLIRGKLGTFGTFIAPIQPKTLKGGLTVTPDAGTGHSGNRPHIGPGVGPYESHCENPSMTAPCAQVIPLRDAPSVRTAAQLPIHLADGREASSTIYSFHGLSDAKEHVALRFGNPDSAAPLVRLHSECLTGDVLGSARCDCGPQLQESLRRLHEEGGYLLYMRQEGRGIGLYGKLEAYRLQELGHDTFAANRALGHGDDERDYTAAAEMLKALGVTRITLITNNHDKRSQLQALGVDVVAVQPTGVFSGQHNLRYLEAKVRHTRHTLALPDAAPET